MDGSITVNSLRTAGVNLEKDKAGHILPNSCCFSITLRCIMRCKMCYIWEGNGAGGSELTVREWKNTVNSLKEVLDTKYDIRLSGGEPLFRKDLLDLLGFIKEAGYKVSLNTNAYLIDKELARAIGDSGLWRICISLDSLNENRQDFLRGRKGSYSRVMRAIEYLNEFCPEVGINIQTVITEQNLDELVSIASWVEENERLDYIYFQAVFRPLGIYLDEYWFRDTRYAFLWPNNINKVNSVIDELLKLKAKNKKIVNTAFQLKTFASYFADPINFGNNIKCTIGNRDININPYGDVSLCPSKGPIGNVRSIDLKKIWYSSLAFEAREQNLQCKTPCHYLLNCCFEGEDCLK